MKAHIAKDAEPELFGDAPVPGDGPLLTLSDSDFYVDPDTGIWWSPSAGPSLGGTVESADATIASVTVTVGSTTVTANLFGGDKWAIGLGANALARPPATNMVSGRCHRRHWQRRDPREGDARRRQRRDGGVSRHDRHRRARRYRQLRQRATDRSASRKLGHAVG